jgi:hypothetical protein
VGEGAGERCDRAGLGIARRNHERSEGEVGTARRTRTAEDEDRSSRFAFLTEDEDDS